MNFGEALEKLIDGKRVARRGWNGKNMYLYLVGAGNYPASTESAKQQFGEELVPYRPYIAMFTVDEDVVPWVASQSDLLGSDWEEVA